ncbi:MAG: MazG nucleotide pyrophosphohydrolase domain-containing protein [archaeon]
MEISEISKFAKIQNAHFREKWPELKDETRLALAQAVKLSEEAGELAEQVLKAQGFQRKEKTGGSVAEEIADVIFATALIADSCGVDLEDALGKKLEKLYGRIEMDRKST